MEELHLECTIKIGQWYEDWYGRYFRIFGLEPADEPWSAQVHIIFVNENGQDVPRKEPQVMEARQVAGMCRLQGIIPQ